MTHNLIHGEGYTRRDARKHLRRQNRKFKKTLSEIPRNVWPNNNDPRRFKVWRSKDFLVQAFSEENGIIRLSVNRTDIDVRGQWRDDISWDELQEIKRMAGYGDFDGVEVFPQDQHVVNVANMRHLWILPEPIEWKWMK